MDHTDHVNLIRKGISVPGGIWADLGSGRGAFTLALAELIGPGGQIHSVDRDRQALRRQEELMMARFPDTAVTYHIADYTQPLELPPLDGVVMANTLHFHHGPKRLRMLQRVRAYLGPSGRLIVVEYDTDRGNRWVPHPFSFRTWQMVAAEAGFHGTQLLATRPSRFLGHIYAAVCDK